MLLIDPAVGRLVEKKCIVAVDRRFGECAADRLLVRGCRLCRQFNLAAAPERQAGFEQAFGMLGSK